MAGIHNVLGLTQCDDINDMVPGQTSPIIAETPTSEMIEEISTYFEAAQGMHGNSSEVSLSAESDSVDQPVVAQVPVSQAHRYRRRQQSHATTASEESGGESASSVSCKNVKGRRKWAFQALRSPFLEGNSFNTTLPSWKRGSMFSTIQQEAKLKTYAVGGFFKCIRLWHRVNEERYVPASSLPAVYMDEDEPLSPLSEGNETSDEDAIKVVENEVFVKLKKGRRPQRQGRTPPSAQTKSHAHAAKTPRQTKTRTRGKGVRGCDSRPVDETGSCDANGPSSPPHRGQPEEEEEEEVRVESAQPEDHLFIESAGDHTMLEESSGLARSDSSSDATCVRDVTLPPARARKRNKRRKPCEMVRESSEVAVKLAPGVAVEHENNNNDDDEEHRKIKKRKKERKRKVTEEEEISIPPDISQPTSGSTMTINGNDHGVDGSVDQLVNVDIVVSHQASAPTETPTVALKKRKRKKDKMAPCPEDPETNPENTEGVEEVALEEAAPETSDVSQRTSGPTMTDANEEHRTRKTKKRLKKRKDTEDVSLDGPCPASETSDVSQPTSGSSVTIIINNDDHSVDGSVGQLEDLWKPREKSKRKKKRIRNGVITEEEVNVVDTVFTEETQTTAVGFKKHKRKKDKMAPCPEDPETNAEAEKTEGVNPLRRPADREVGRPGKKRRKHKMAETPQSASRADTPVEASGSTSVRGEKKRKRGHSFLIDDTAENHPEPNASVVGFDDQKDKNPDVENGETPMESLTGETVKTKKKKKKREREASRASVVAEDDEAREGGVQDTRSSAETGDDDDGVRKKKKKKKKDKKADGESESPVVVEGETPDYIETTVWIKKKDKRRRNTRPPSQGSTPTKACVESGVTTPADAVTASPRPCLPVVDDDATQGGHVATPADPPANKKTGKKREKKNRSSVVTRDTVPERDIITTAEPPDRWTAETELRVKKKKKKKRERSVTDRIEAETDPGAKEAQQSSHESGVTSPDPVPPESRTQLHDGASSPRRVQKRTHRRKRLFSQQQDFPDISILT